MAALEPLPILYFPNMFFSHGRKNHPSFVFRNPIRHNSRADSARSRRSITGNNLGFSLELFVFISATAPPGCSLPQTHTTRSPAKKTSFHPSAPRTQSAATAPPENSPPPDTSPTRPNPHSIPPS